RGVDRGGEPGGRVGGRPAGHAQAQVLGVCAFEYHHHITYRHIIPIRVLAWVEPHHRSRAELMGKADELAVVASLRRSSGNPVQEDIGYAIPRPVIPRLRLDLADRPLTVDRRYVAEDRYPLGFQLADYRGEMRIGRAARPGPGDVQDDVPGRRLAVGGQRPGGRFVEVGRYHELR